MNIESYFLIVLGGFALVWGYRWSSESRNTLGEFEYAAMSAIWGSVLLFCLLFVGNSLSLITPERIENWLAAPFMISPIIAFAGFILGVTAGTLVRFK